MAFDITLRGRLPDTQPEDTAGLSVYLVRGTDVLAEVPVGEDGQFALGVDRQALGKSEARVELVVAPAGLSDRLDAVEQAQRLPLDQAQLQKAEREFQVPTKGLTISPAIRKIWGLHCRRYTVSGTVTGPNGCPAPHAGVTAYNVTHVGGSLYSKITLADVVTNEHGEFTATFTWCSHRWRPCWPCWPWWSCWPWWWEWDILHVLDHLEAQRQPVRLPPRPIGPRPVPGPLVPPIPLPAPALKLTMPQPEGRELLRGQAFAQFRKPSERLVADEQRTALIARRLADPQIRAIFPWWWWCCDNPNIVFTVRQGAGPVQIVLEEQPATDTRWCFASGQHVTLVGNAQTITLCPGPPPPAQGFAWARVGESVMMDHIVQGYATTWSGDGADAAFAGTLDIYGEFGPDPNAVGYYQVHAGQWTGNPARGGMAPIAGGLFTGELYNQAIILHPNSTVTFPNVKMGPFDLPSGPSNVYATQQRRAAVPAALLPSFLNAGDVLLGWGHSGRKVSTNAAALIGGASVGAVRLTVTAYDNAGTAIIMPANTADTLDLQIDNTSFTAAHINSLHAFRVHHTPPAPDEEVLNPTGSDDCPAFHVGPGGYVKLNVTVRDDNGHVGGYRINPQFGHGSTGTGVTPPNRSYSDPVPGTFPPAPYQKPDTAHKSFVGGTEDITYHPLTNCCYDFQLAAVKRVTDGTNRPGEGIYDSQRR